MTPATIGPWLMAGFGFILGIYTCIVMQETGWGKALALRLQRFTLDALNVVLLVGATRALWSTGTPSAIAAWAFVLLLCGTYAYIITCPNVARWNNVHHQPH